MSLDKPHHGWEGISNGGEIYGESKNRENLWKSNDDIGSEMMELADEINRVLEEIRLEAEKDIESKENNEESSNRFHR